MKNRFVVCLTNQDFEAALEPRKIYLLLEDPEAESEGLLRVVDESGEDYLYPTQMFQVIEVPEAAIATLFSLAS